MSRIEPGSVSDNDSCTIGKRVGKIDVRQCPVFRWRRKAVTLPTGGDSRKAATDDQVVQIYLVTQSPDFGRVLPIDGRLFGEFLNQQIGFTILLSIFGASGLVANDLRTGAILAYLSRPLTRRDYVCFYGAFAGPWSAGTSLGVLLQSATDANAAGPASFVRGGMGALTQALASAAKALGAEVRTNADVARIETRDGAVTGVVLTTGEEVPARAVVSSADPKRTLLALVDPVDLDPAFIQKIRK